MTTVLGRISGPLLEENLLRNGVDLSFLNTASSDPVLFLDVNTNRIGVAKNFASSALDVDGGDIYSTNANADSLQVPNITISNDDIVTLSSSLNITASGNVYLTGLGTDDLLFDGNTISTTQTDSNLEIIPDGTGIVEFLSNSRVQADTTVVGNITLDGDFILGNSSSDTLDFNSEIVGDLLPVTSITYDLGSSSLHWLGVYATDTYIANSGITTPAPGDNLTLQAANDTYNVVIENTTISDSVISNTSGNQILEPTRSLNITNNTALQVPVGTTAQRITGTQFVIDGGDATETYSETVHTTDATNDVTYTDTVYHGGKAVNDPVMNDADFRYNTTYGLYESYGGLGVRSYGSVYSDDKISYIATEPSGDGINFIIDETAILTADSGILAATKMKVSDIIFDQNNINSSENIHINTQGTGKVVYTDLSIGDTTLTNTGGSDLTLGVTGLGYNKINGVYGVVVPYGDTASRPSSPQVADTRYNTDSGLLETYTGAAYADSWGSAVTPSEFQDILDEYSLIFG